MDSKRFWLPPHPPYQLPQAPPICSELRDHRHYPSRWWVYNQAWPVCKVCKKGPWHGWGAHHQSQLKTGAGGGSALQPLLQSCPYSVLGKGCPVPVLQVLEYRKVGTLQRSVGGSALPPLQSTYCLVVCPRKVGPAPVKGAQCKVFQGTRVAKKGTLQRVPEQPRLPRGLRSPSGGRSSHTLLGCSSHTLAH